YGFVGYPFNYHVTLGFGSIAGGIDHVNPVIRLPLEHGISMGLFQRGLIICIGIIGQAKDIYSGTMAGVDINTLTMEQYLALSRENQAPSMVKPEIEGNVNFEIKSQFMREFREDTLSENKNEDAYNHVDRVFNIGPIPGMTPTQALTEIQTMADHSQKWHDGTSSRNLSSSNNTDGLAAIVSILDNLGRDMKKLKENVHAIEVECQICKGPHLDK
ncbi:hypothetical protein Tco_1432235, partial [Tanacetum coccineum]